ncbi:MAG: response regulator [Clostridia bacterium]|nr:response regulator [Clostridia bacterium]
MRVLIVEDEQAARKGLAQLLGQVDSRVEIAGQAADGRQGLAQLRALSPDIVFADIRMPVMDGLQMIRAAVAQGLKTRFVVVSAFAEFEYARQAMALGVQDYLVKPITLDDLTALFDRLMPALPDSAAACHPLVRKTMETIDRDYREAINLASISAQLDVTPEYLSYLFHRDTGINFSAYLRRQRIDRAVALMRQGQDRIYEIARAVGYYDAKYFCRVFREVMGKSPSAYLRELEKPEADE